MIGDCPFCRAASGPDLLADNDLAVAFTAGFPVSVGVNAGKAAGQTILHVHLHVIPRYAGDVAEPRGGVRWVLPETARYW